jgi:hypothetical protein
MEVHMKRNPSFLEHDDSEMDSPDDDNLPVYHNAGSFGAKPKLNSVMEAHKQMQKCYD